MSGPRLIALLSLALVAALAVGAATVTAAAAPPPPSRSATPFPSLSPTPFPSPSTSPLPSPSPAPSPSTSPTPFPSPSPTPSPAPPCVAPPVVTPPSDPEGASVVQDETQAVGGQILDLVDQNGYPGFTGLIADPDNARLLLCWLHDDPLPAPIAALVASPGQPITVVREDTPFSYSQLAPLTGTIDGNSSLGAEINGAVDGVVVPEEGTGLIAEVVPNDPGTFDQGLATAVLSSAAGVPVTVEVSAAPSGFTRLSDTSPWSGGARLTTGGPMPQPICSSGFGMKIGSTPYLLTANHCGVQAFFNGQLAGAARQRIGAVTQFIPVYDSEAIAIDNPNTASRNIYRGGVNDATEGSVRIAAVGVNIRNQFVCTSGSFSGQHCLLQIRFTNLFIPGAILGLGVAQVGPLNYALAPRGGVTAAKGDSGGPVAQRQANGAVLGLGTISGGFNLFPCVVYDGRVCGSDLFYPHLSLIMRAYGGALP